MKEIALWLIFSASSMTAHSHYPNQDFVMANVSFLDASSQGSRYENKSSTNQPLMLLRNIEMFRGFDLTVTTNPVNSCFGTDDVMKLVFKNNAWNSESICIFGKLQTKDILYNSLKDKVR